jgi:hypothetical protein
VRGNQRWHSRHSKKRLTAFESTLAYIPAILSYFKGVNGARTDGLCSIFERCNHGIALRIARGLNVVREYVRGDADVLREIAQAWDLYVKMFPEPPKE